MSKEFYINLSEDSRDTSLAALVEHALDALKTEVENKPFTLTHFTLVRPYTDDDRPSLFVAYDWLSGSDVKLQDENIKWREQEKVSAEAPSSGLRFNQESTAELNVLTTRLPQSEQQGDCIKLIETLAADLRAYGVSNALDVVYHPYCDNDGLSHPYIVTYFDRQVSKN